MIAAIYLAMGVAVAGRTLLEFAQPQYYDPVTTLDYVAVWSYSLALGLLAIAIPLLARDAHAGRLAMVAAIVSGSAAGSAAVANGIQDGIGVPAFGSLYVPAVLVMLLGLLVLALLLAREGRRRAAIVAGLHTPDPSYDNSCLNAGPEGVMVVGFTKPELVQYEGKRLSEIARLTGKDWAEVIIDFNVAEEARLSEILFLMNEENVRMQIRKPWIKWGTDAGAQDPATAKGMMHPRAYGDLPRLLGKYVREEGVIPLEEAIAKGTAAVATRLSIGDRGVLRAGMKADIIVFDPATIGDRATFEKPHQLSVGMVHVLVNGVAVLRDGVHTGATPGQVVRGPAWKGSPLGGER